MKSFYLFLALILVFPAAACKHGLHTGVKGSGNRVVQKRDIASFTSISTEGAFTVEVKCQKNLALEVEADDNILPLVSTEVSGSVLRLKNSANYSVREPVVVRISVPDIEGLAVSGAGSIDISGMKNDKFEIDSSGAPSIKVSGVTKVVEIDTSGAAKIDTHNLHASRAIVDSKGVSKVDLDVSDQLDVKISGPSYVTYEGNPTVNQTINGPGKLQKKQTVEGA
jgi:Putative auto-transporter adhesin, head GIN domain